MKEYPKVLAIGHNCFSKEGSNGRTLANLFTNWPTDSLAQFYISNEIPNSYVCNNYYRVKDIEALKAFFGKKTVGGRINTADKKSKNIQDNNEKKKKSSLIDSLYKRFRKRSPIKYIIRNKIWDSNKWKSDDFYSWIDDFNPDVILVVMGDYAFMLRIALSIAKKRNIPLVIYNSEDFYFKGIKSKSPIYNFYRKDYETTVREVISYSSYSIYNSEMLQDTYSKEFDYESTVIMNATDLKPLENKKENKPLVVSYLGSLGVGRHESLIKVANELNKLDSNIYLNVYGEIRYEEVEKALKSCSSIKLKGFVPYNEVVRVMRTSDLLVHVESFNDYYKEYVKHGFSTKIADSLASGTCLFVFAPSSIAFVKYLQKTDAAYVVTDEKKLEKSIKEIIENKELRLAYEKKGYEVALKNHSLSNNAEKFEKIMTSLL